MSTLAPYFPPLPSTNGDVIRGARWAAECARAMADRCSDTWNGIERARALKAFAETVHVELDAIPPESTHGDEGTGTQGAIE